MLVSLHIPKAAGSSFALSLKEYYGTSFIPDYNDIPLNTNPAKRKSQALIQSGLNRIRHFTGDTCIHGHFLPLKYKYVVSSKPVTYITWFREPAERLASQYYYMIRHYNPSKAQKRPMLKRIVEEKWTLEQFCFSKEFKNSYSQFLWGFDIKSFDFIGIVEHYESDLEYFSQQFLSRNLIAHQENTNSDKKNKSYFDDDNLKKAVQKFHNTDTELYHKALSIRSTRELMER